MALSEHARSVPGLDFRILATDISTRVLTQAKQRIYDTAQVEVLPAAWRQRYLAPSKDKARKLARVRPELRRRVSFHRLNFMAPDYAVRDSFDIIFFRNVAIYFDQPTQTSVIAKLTAQLSSGGYFFIGLSEALKSPVAGLQKVDHRSSCASKDAWRMQRKIRVLIVDDSATVRQTLSQVLSSDPEIEVMATASDPYVAVRHMQQEMPDVISLDIEMPRLDGLSFLEKIMRQHPLPVVICSTLTTAGSETALAALEKGAVEVIAKPKLGTKAFLEESRVSICEAVRAAAS